MTLPSEIATLSIEPTHRLSLMWPDTFLETIRSCLKRVIPISCDTDIHVLLKWLQDELPIIWWPKSELQEEEHFPCTFPIFFLYPARFSAGLERYIKDTLSRRLINGAQVASLGQMGLQFYFTQNPTEHFYFNQQLIGVNDAEEKREIVKNLTPLFHEMKLNMAAVCQGRHLRIQKAIHPTFMPRNEEDLFRTLVQLSKEVQYVKDLPQVSIHFERQTETQLVFIVLLVRVKTEDLPCFHQLFSNRSIRFEVDEIRILGKLRRKHPKEAATLHVFVEKAPFFRPDFSVDLLRARGQVAAELGLALGEFRDFNGGMILKQEETLAELRKLLGPLSQQNEFLLENYFYSMRPVIAQTIHDPSTLKIHFEMLLENMETSFDGLSYRLFRSTEGAYDLYFLFSPRFDARKMVRELKKEPHRAVTSILSMDRLTALGWIVKKDKVDWAEKIDRWMKTI